MIKFNLWNNPVYFRIPLLIFSDIMKRIKVKRARTNNVVLTYLKSLNSEIQIAQRGFRIKKIKPKPEAMPWILPEIVSAIPFGSSGKMPAKIVPIPNRIIPKINNLWHHFIWVNAKPWPTENIRNKIPTAIRLIHWNSVPGFYWFPGYWLYPSNDYSPGIWYQ